MAGPGSRVAVGVIGAGNFARNLHIPNLSRIPECEFRWVCDLDREVLDGVGRRYAVPTTTDHRRLLDDPAIDAVVIAVRDDLQAAMACEALAAGKHVYVEKPLARTPEACTRVVDAREAAGRRCAVGFNRRYAPIYLAARDAVDADGGPRNLHLRMTDDAWRWAKGYDPGFLIHLDCCHFFDLLRWFTREEIVAVCCASARPDDDALVLQTSGGKVASITLSGHGTMDMPKERLEIISERGGISAEDFVELRTYGYGDREPVTRFAGHSHPDHEFMHKYLYRSLGMDALRSVRRVTWELRQQVENGFDEIAPDADEIRRYVAETIPNFMRDQGWMESLRAFVRGIATGEPTHHAGPEDALIAATVADAAVRSREEGLVVRLED